MVRKRCRTLEPAEKLRPAHPGKRTRTLDPPTVPASSSRATAGDVTTQGSRKRSLQQNEDLKKRMKSEMMRLEVKESLEDALTRILEASQKAAGRDEDSDGTTSEAEVGHSDRQRQLQQRSKIRLRLHLDEVLEGRQTGLSFLERKSVTGKVLEEYDKELNWFISQSGIGSLERAGDSEVDEELIRHFERLYLEGHQAFRGEKLLASLMFHYPGFGKNGGRKIPRAWRGLKGWRRLTPGRSRKPLLMGVWMALVVELCRMNMYAKAAFLAMMLSTYMRPGEMMGMRVEDLVPPVRGVSSYWTVVVCPQERPARTKVGASDDSIRLDSAWCPWMNTVCEALTSGRKKHEKLWPFTYPEFVRAMKESCKRLGIDAVPYQARHSGASIDRASGERSLADIKKRGRWAHDKSVVRYEKHGRLQTSALAFSTGQRAYFETCARHVEAALVFGNFERIGQPFSR